MKCSIPPTITWSKLLLSALLISSCYRAEVVAAATATADNAEQNSTIQPIPGDLLRAAADDQATRQFYESEGWQPLWSDAAISALEHSLGEREKHGLDHIDFGDDLRQSASPAQLEVAHTRAALRYAAALAHGVTDPTQLHTIYTIPRPQVNLVLPLARALSGGNLAAWLESLAPQDADYARLAQAYLDAQQDTGSANQGNFAAGTIRVGETDSRVPAIAAQLVAAEYLAGQASEVGSAQYTQRIADAVKHLQRDYGIVADGIVGQATLEVLNLRPGDRAQLLAVALERLRWLPRTPPATRIDVNTAAARLNYYRDGRLIDSRRVIVGQPGTETPQLQAPIFRLVANPTWTIPKSIQRGEMAGVSTNYLRRHNMFRRNGWIVQKSGPKNALGLVKFDMINDQAIYLHDTSAPALFDRSQRQLSHGCVRVEDALSFAQMIAEDGGVADKWRRARATNGMQFIALPQQIPVRLLYNNVFVENSGDVAFRTDPYGWNAPIAKALGFDNVSRSRARSDTLDIAP